MEKTNKQLSLIPLPVIYFEGQMVKPSKAGFYKCPFKCGSPGFPQPKWKTEGGFRNHMLSCKNRPSFINASAEMNSSEEPKRTRSFSEFMDETFGPE